MAAGSTNNRAEFVRLREAYELLADIYDIGGQAERSGKNLKLSSIPRPRWKEISGRLSECQELVSQLLEGPGEKKAYAGETEVVLATMEVNGDIQVCALEMKGRSKISRSLSFFMSEDGWQDRLASFVSWDATAAVVAAADGNNQRAIIGLVLSLAGIGRGMLAMVEVEIPQEIDEATHLVRGSVWMKAGLPRFRSAASEALWYAMRLRSVHSRVVRTKKQGLYTSMGMTALYGAGFSVDKIATMTGTSTSLVEKLTFTSQDKHASEKDREFVKGTVLGDAGQEIGEGQMNAALRIWKGPAIFLRGMNWRLSVSRKARQALAEGQDLVEVAESFRIQRRELVRILSVSLSEAATERDRFVSGVVKPSTLQRCLT